MLYKLYIKLFKIILIIVPLLVLLNIALGKEFIGFWLSNQAASEIIYTTFCALLIGSSLNMFYNIGYLNWLVQGKNILYIGLIPFFTALCALPVLIKMYGFIGASFSWILINIIGLVLSLSWLKLKK